MNKRSTFLFGLLALVLAFGLVVAGCEGPAGPAGPAGGSGGPGGPGSGGDTPQVILDGFNAYALYAELKEAGFAVTAPGYGVTDVTVTGAGTFDWDTAADAQGNYALPEIPARVTLKFTTATAIAIPEAKTLTIAGGEDSVLSLGVASAITLANGSSPTTKTTLAITVPTGLTATVVNPVTVGSNAEITLTNKTVTLNGSIAVDTAVVTNLKLTSTEIDLVAHGTISTAGAAAFKSVTVSGTSFSPGAAVTASGGITLKSGSFVAGGYTHVADVTVTGTASFDTSAVLLDTGKKITVKDGGALTVAYATTAPGGVVVEDGGTLSIGNIALATTGGTSTNVDIESGGRLIFSTATLPTLTNITGALRVKDGAALRLGATSTFDAAGIAALAGYLQSGATLELAAGVTLAIPQSATLDLSTGKKVALLGTGAKITLAASGTNDTNSHADVGKIIFAANVSISGGGSAASTCDSDGQLAGVITMTAAEAQHVTTGSKDTDLIGDAALAGTATLTSEKGAVVTVASNVVTISAGSSVNVLSSATRIIKVNS